MLSAKNRPHDISAGIGHGVFAYVTKLCDIEKSGRHYGQGAFLNLLTLLRIPVQ